MGEPGSSKISHLTLAHVTTVPATLGFLRGQLAFMKAHGFDIHVVTSPGAGLDRFASDEHVCTHALPMERRVTPARDIVSLWRLFRLFRAIGPDIVHASTPKGGLLGVLAGRLANVPVIIYQVRGLAFTGLGGPARLLMRLTERIACGAAHHVLAVSPSLRDEMLHNKLTYREKISVLASGSSNGVAAETRFNPERFTAADNEKLAAELGIPAGSQVIGFVGRLVRDKGILELAAAWKRVAKDHPRAWLLIVGEWETRDAVPQRIRQELGAHPRVRLAGEQRDVARFYSLMDLVVLPTFREGFPNVPLEAAAMEKPVVTTAVTGAVDAVVAGVTGTLVPAGDAQALANAMRKYLEDPGLGRSHGRAGRERTMRDFLPLTIWKATLAKYLEWLSESGVPVSAGADGSR